MQINYRKISLILGLSLFGIWLLSGVYLVNNNEEAIELRFRKITREGIQPGIHYHLPVPFESAFKLPVRKTQRITIGRYQTPEVVRSLVDTNQFQYDTVYPIIKRITGDVNIINLIATIQYTITDISDYAFVVSSPDTLMISSFESAAVLSLSGKSVDYILTTGKVEIRRELVNFTQDYLDKYNAGIEIVDVNLKEISPPEMVADAFKDVINAETDAKRFINQAHGYKNSKILEAEGEAENILKEANSYREEQINSSLGEIERFNSLYSKYLKSSETNRNRLYLETIDSIGKKIKKIIISSQFDTTMIRIYGLDKNIKNIP